MNTDDFADLGPELHESHVLLRCGLDLAAAGIFEYAMNPCLFCDSDELVLSDEEQHGRFDFFVCCGGCGMSGPVGRTESEALARWNHPMNRESGWASEYLQMIEDCESRDSRLSDWDRGFLDSIKSQIEAGRMLSTKQTEKLDEIWERATARG